MKRGGLLLLLSAFGLVALPAAPAAAAAKAAVKRDWTRTVVLTPQGGFRMGNPKAAIKLVEYGSLACPHCRHFEQTGYKPLLQNYVRGGKLSYEFRNLLISGPDIAMTLLTRCSGPAKFFAMSQHVFATQPEWQDKLEKMSDADKAALEPMTDQQRVVRYAEIADMGEIAARFGVTPTRAKQCLADPKALKGLLDLTKKAIDGGVKQTPTFFINGKMTDAASWEDLEPLIRKAGGRG
jgi:protein-disulfide isomerase